MFDVIRMRATKYTHTVYRLWYSGPGPGNTIRGKPQFPGPAHNNTGLWYFFPSERLGKLLKYNGSNPSLLKILLNLIDKSI